MKSKNLSIMVMFLSLIFVFVGCKKEEAFSPKQEATLLQIVKFGPVKIQAGKDFNVQPDGHSAMWAKTENATKTTVLVWGETQLRTVASSPTTVSANLPKELYSKPGKFQIYLLDTKTGAKSNTVTIVVE